MAFIPTIGQMVMPVQLERVVKDSEGTGGQDEAYDSWFRGRAYLKRKSGERNLQDGYDYTINRYSMWIIWRQAIETDLDKDVRVIYEARNFRIETYTLVDEKRRLYRFELIEAK